MNNKCSLCGKEITQKMEDNQTIIKISASHPVCGVWNDMGEYYLCSWECWGKLNLGEQ